MKFEHSFAITHLKLVLVAGHRGALLLPEIVRLDDDDVLHLRTECVLQQFEYHLDAGHVVAVAAHVEQHGETDGARRLAGQPQQVGEYASHVLRLDPVASRRRREAEQRSAASVASAAEDDESVLQQLLQAECPNAIHGSVGGEGVD